MAGHESASPESKPAELVAGLTNPRALALERFPVRTREGSTTRSAWRLSASCDQGDGAIVFVEASPAETFYRGDGIFLGWAQERMAAAYRALRPEPEDDGFQTQQMG